MKHLLKLLNQRPISYYKIYADITGSVKSGVLLSQIMYWWSTKQGDEFYKTDKGWQEETGLSVKELRSAKTKIESLGVVTLTRRGVPAKTFYKVNAEKLESVLTSYSERAQLEMPKGNNLSSQKGTTITETTTETTTEIKDSDAAKAGHECLECSYLEGRVYKYCDNCQPDRLKLPASSQNGKQGKKPGRAKKAKMYPIPDKFMRDPEFMGVFDSWLEHRRNIGKPFHKLTDRGLTAFFNKLLEYSGKNVDKAIEVIDQSLSNGYTGIFPLKENKQETEVTDEWINKQLDKRKEMRIQGS